MRRLAGTLIALLVLGWQATVLAADALPQPVGPVILTITGKIEQTNANGQARFDAAMLESLGLQSFTTAFTLADGPHLFEGVPLKAVLERVGARGTVLKAKALNDYKVDIPVDDVRYDPLLALRSDGQTLKIRDKGPIWLVYPRERHEILQDVKYDSRWIWQLKQLHVE